APVAGTAMAAGQPRFVSVDVGLGQRVDARQARAALKLADARRAPYSTAMWRLVREALPPLEQVESDFARAEYPPFDRWYHETWIRAGLQLNNPHRAYVELRAFIASDGRSRLQPPPGFGQPPAAAGANPAVRTP